MKKPLIVMPAYNVEKEISNVLDAMREYYERLVVINDGSNDATLDVVKRKDVIVLDNEVNKGISFCADRGIKWAKEHGFDKIILMDADGQHDPQFIPQFDNELNFYDIVCGSRFKNSRYVPSAKIASNMMAALLVNSVWESGIKDVACGFKAFCLYKGIEDAINVLGKYSMVYDILIYSLQNKLKIANVDINPIYYPEEFWYTRVEELKALFETIEFFASKDNVKNLGIENLKAKIFQRQDFCFNISGFDFYLFFLQNVDGYIIQSDLKKLFEYANGDF